jgi:hypothetical protein
MSDQDRLPWRAAAEEAKGHLADVDWSQLRGALDACEGFARFVASFEALMSSTASITQREHTRDPSDTP